MRPYSVKLAMLAILTLFLAVALAAGRQPQPQISPAQGQAQENPPQNPPHVDQQTNPEARAVEKSIRDALNQDPHMAFSNVSVHTSGGEIILTGSVLTSAAKDQAEKIATEHAGGTKVTNKIRVNPNIHPR